MCHGTDVPEFCCLRLSGRMREGERREREREEGDRAEGEKGKGRESEAHRRRRPAPGSGRVAGTFLALGVPRDLALSVTWTVAQFPLVHDELLTCHHILIDPARRGPGRDQVQEHRGPKPENALVCLAPWLPLLDGGLCANCRSQVLSPLGTNCLSPLSPSVRDESRSHVEPRSNGSHLRPHLTFPASPPSG